MRSSSSALAELRVLIERFVVPPHQTGLLDLLTRPAKTDPHDTAETAAGQDEVVLKWMQRFVGADSDEPAEAQPRSTGDDVLDVYDEIVRGLHPENVERFEEADNETMQAFEARLLARLRALGARDMCTDLWAWSASLEDHESLEYAVSDVLWFQPGSLLCCVSGHLYFIEDFYDRHLIISDALGAISA